MRTVTIRDVAKHAGVGLGTVPRVINDSPQVSKETRQRVFKTIETLNYIPNPTARHLSRKNARDRGDTQALGVLETAKQLGIRVPEDLSVIGYNDIELIIRNTTAPV